GWEEKELLGREVAFLFPDSRAKEIERALRKKPTAHHDICLLKKDGSELDVVLATSELRGTADELVGMVCIVTDNTVHKQREAKLQKRVTERTRALERSQAELAQSDRLASLGFLVAGMGHEINNPLSYVLGNLEELAQDSNLASARPRIEEALEGARRVRDVV